MLKQYQFLLLAGSVLLVLFMFTGGCQGLKNYFSKKNTDPALATFDVPEFETENGKPKLVMDCAYVNNFDNIPVHGVGLVVDLPGTGGEDIGSAAYQMVYEDMNKRRVPDIRATLAHPSTAVVEIIGRVPPGSQIGDRFDIQVALPENSNTKSLVSGRLLEARLTETIVSDNYQGSSSTRALAAGPIMVDDLIATETTNPAGLKKGIILSGAITAEPRALSLVMKDKSLIMTDRIAKTINQRFPLAGQQNGIATAHTDEVIILKVYHLYANNVPRYVKVIQSMACYETPAQQVRRIERLREELLHPATAQHAAFQLEAIGKMGIPALQQALKSSDMEVRFHAATSLAYLGDGTAARVLAECIRVEPAFRIYALDALGVMRNDLEAEAYLQDLLHVPSNETRYGAFRSLKHRNPMDQTIRGEMLEGQFSYHVINTQTAPMVHITTTRYPEIVLFGTNTFLRQPFTLEAGPLFFVNGQSPNEVVVSKFATLGTDERRTVSNRLDDVIRAVVELGGTYPDVVQMLRKADMMNVLSCRLEIDCLPEPNRIYRRSGGEDLDVGYEEEEKQKSFWERMHLRNVFTPNPGERTSDFTGTVNTSSRD